jgi:hypothetical protein
MNSRGFVIYAEGKTHLKQAYLAALSLQAADNTYPISVITNCTVSKKFRKAFDKIIEIPWYEESQTDLCAENRWKIYHATPYENTIVLDSDVLVLENLEYFWNFVENYELYFPTEVFTYRKEKITSDYYRKAFTENNLPNLYNCVHYFSKSQFAQEFYAWVELVTNNWELFYGKFCSEHYPKQPSMDVTAAIVSKILDCDTEISNQNNDLLEIIHMKPMIQNWNNPKSTWQSNVGTYLTEDLQLKIGNHRQDTVFHYTENSFCQDNIIRKFEECLNL